MLTISWCSKIEEIIAKDEDDDVKNEIINFKKLRSLELEQLPRLKCFCSDNYTLMFPSLDRVIIRGCPRLSMFCPGDIHTPLLKGVVSGYETKELWETNLNKTILLLLTDEVTYLELYPEMKNLWVEKLAHPKPFSKLGSLSVDNCDFLCEYVIPAHLVKCLSNLKWLKVRNCHSIKTILELIVAEDETSSEEESPCFVFPQLSYLELEKLPNLKSFYPQTCTLECPQLKRLFVHQCENLKTFGTRITGITELRQKDKVKTQQSLFLAEKDATNMYKQY